MSIADFDAPITVTGRITRYQADPADVNPQLWLEASEVSPATTFGSKAGTVWVVAGFPFNVQDDWIGRTVVIRGLNAEDKRCQPQCLMAGDSIQLVQ
jgi:hypothetical protein